MARLMSRVRSGYCIQIDLYYIHSKNYIGKRRQRRQKADTILTGGQRCTISVIASMARGRRVIRRESTRSDVDMNIVGSSVYPSAREESHCAHTEVLPPVLLDLRELWFAMTSDPHTRMPTAHGQPIQRFFWGSARARVFLAFIVVVVVNTATPSPGTWPIADKVHANTLYVRDRGHAFLKRR